MSADKSPQPLYMDPGEYMKHGQFKESVKYLDPGEYIQPGQYKESSLGRDKDKDKVKTSHNGFTFKQKINGAIAVAVLALLVLIVGMIVFKKYGEKDNKMAVAPPAGNTKTTDQGINECLSCSKWAQNEGFFNCPLAVRS